jgi:hypothetical protein
MPVRLKLEDVQKIFADHGCWLVSDQYRSNKKPLDYICSCHIGEDDPLIHQTTLCAIQRGIRCEDCRDMRTKDTLMERRGVTHLTQIPEIKEKMLSGIKKYVEEKKHKLEDLKIIYEEAGCKLLATEYINSTVKMPFICVCGREYENTYGDFSQNQRCGFLDCINIRRDETNMIKYGGNYSKTEEFKNIKTKSDIILYGTENNITEEQQKNRDERKAKSIATSRKNWNTDHPMQNLDVLAKNQKHRFKEYKYPSGNIIKVQGYEPWALDILLKTYNEKDIITDRKLIPEIWYFMDSSYHIYIPDIYIPKHNLIIEVKSTWTYNLHKYLVHEKSKAVKYLGYIFELYIFDDKGNKIN